MEPQWEDILSDLRDRTGMYVLSPRLNGAAAYIEGFSRGRGDDVMPGFRRWFSVTHPVEGGYANPVSYDRHRREPVRQEVSRTVGTRGAGRGCRAVRPHPQVSGRPGVGADTSPRHPDEVGANTHCGSDLAIPSLAMQPALRARTSQGEVYDDPSEDLLFELLADLSAESDYLIVERPADTSGQTYAQVMRTTAGYLLERRDGSEDTHAHAISDDMRAVHEDLTTWAFTLDRGYGLAWAKGYGR